MLPQPCSKRRFLKFSGRNRQHRRGGFELRCLQAQTVDGQKKADTEKSRALVSIDKGVILSNAHPIARR